MRFAMLGTNTKLSSRVNGRVAITALCRCAPMAAPGFLSDSLLERRPFARSDTVVVKLEAQVRNA
eukprot:5258903-Prymnesium_polylepis.1